jgi:spore coat polysaccharide biosynthesis predicted glycosyltransferase SpsG
MSFKNILIRSDGSNDIGLGHITRCLTFANYLKKKKINSTFVTSTNEISEVVLNSGFNCIFLEV